MNDGDAGYVASKAKKDNLLKAKREKILKSPTNSPPPATRTRRTRRRRVVIEESEDEEIDDGHSNEGNHSRKHSIEDPDQIEHSRNNSIQTASGYGMSPKRRRSHFPMLHVEEPTSPSTEGPSNRTNSTDSRFPASEENMNSYHGNFDHGTLDHGNLDGTNFDFDTNNLDKDTLAGADTLLAFATGTPGPRRVSTNDNEMTFHAGQATTTSNNVTQQYARASFGSQNGGHNVKSFTALTPGEPTWTSTPAAYSTGIPGLFPYNQDFDFDKPLWSSTTIEPMSNFDGTIDNVYGNLEDPSHKQFYSNGVGNSDLVAKATGIGSSLSVSDHRHAVSDAMATGALSANSDEGTNANQDQGWTVPEEEEEEEEGEIKENGGTAGS